MNRTMMRGFFRRRPAGLHFSARTLRRRAATRRIGAVMSTGGLFAMLTGALVGGAPASASTAGTTQVTLKNAVGTQITCASTSTWHFVTNQLDSGTPAGTIVATFNPGGPVGPVTATVVNSSEQGFFVTAPSGTQTLVTAVATFQQQADPTKANLVLSGSPSCDTTSTTSSSTSTSTSTSTSSTSTSTSTSSTSSTSTSSTSTSSTSSTSTSTTSTTEEGRRTTTTVGSSCCAAIPTTTTVAPTTSTVPATTPTTAGAQVLAEQGTTSLAPTTSARVVARAVPTVVLGVQGTRSTLPFTGSDTRTALLAAGVLLLLGGLLLLGSDGSESDASQSS